MRIASRFSARSGLAITLFWVAALAVTGSTEALLFLAPALLIGIPLLGGRYVGEELIARIAERFRRRKSRPISVARPSRWAVSFGFSLLLLAGIRPLRGPPLLS